MGQPYAKRETEEARLRVDASGEDRVEGGEIVVREATVESLQVVADVLAKSVVLGFYETRLASIFDAVEPFAQGLKGRGRATPKDRDLLRYIGDTLLTQHQMVGRVEVGEKPDVLWELPGLNRLFSRLEWTSTSSRSASSPSTASSTSSRARWRRSRTCCRTSARSGSSGTSSILIVIEIVLTLYQLFVVGH